MLSWINNLRKAFGQQEATDISRRASEEAQQTLNNTNVSDASDLYKEGRAAAGVAAADKAGIAKKQAKAATAMNNGSKTLGAIQAAQAATDAVQEGYDTAASNAASLQAGQEGRELEKAKSIASAQQHAGDVASQEAMRNTQNAWNTVGTFAKGLFS